MSFHYTERNREEYITDGFTILRDLIPATLLADLRRETDKVREIARAKYGRQTQRLQPVYAYEELDSQPFRDFLGLPELRATVEGILGPEHTTSDIMGVLLEPAERAWCTHWHRDWGYNAAHVDLEEFFQAIKNLRMFNQLNGALYDDHSLWVVPGSHARQDTSEERTVFPSVPPPAPAFPEELSAASRELTCLTYVRCMPGAIPVMLFAGDVAFYRACQWHIGNYVPYIRRATLHDGFYGPEDRAWQAEVRRRQQAAKENP
ncbi:MAG TPA: phytanoyl-CoA dioxygenase family protein [Chthonomonadaceae bacterium]|nr:phytanoyl-CoA dioxygenase family protein [Chthonomonadaceae bacterium]